MFRVVVKSNLSMGLAMNLTKVMRDTLIVLDSLDDGYESMKARMLALNAKKQVLTELPKIQVKEGKRIKALANTVMFKLHMERKKAQRSNLSGYMVSQHAC